MLAVPPWINNFKNKKKNRKLQLFTKYEVDDRVESFGNYYSAKYKEKRRGQVRATWWWVSSPAFLMALIHFCPPSPPIGLGLDVTAWGFDAV